MEFGYSSKIHFGHTILVYILGTTTFKLFNIHFKEQKNKVENFDLVPFGGNLNFIKMD